MAKRTFSATVAAWAGQTMQDIEKIRKESAKRVVSRAQQYISGELVNVQTGFLRASVQGSNSVMPQIDPKAYPGEGATHSQYKDGLSEIVLMINTTQPVDPIYIGYTAAYSAFVHDGTSKMAPRPYVLLAARQWPQIVNRVTEELKSRRGVQP